MGPGGTSEQLPTRRGAAPRAAGRTRAARRRRLDDARLAPRGHRRRATRRRRGRARPVDLIDGTVMAVQAGLSGADALVEQDGTVRPRRLPLVRVGCGGGHHPGVAGVRADRARGRPRRLGAVHGPDDDRAAHRRCRAGAAPPVPLPRHRGRPGHRGEPRRPRLRPGRRSHPRPRRPTRPGTVGSSSSASRCHRSRPGASRSS